MIGRGSDACASNAHNAIIATSSVFTRVLLVVIYFLMYYESIALSNHLDLHRRHRHALDYLYPIVRFSSSTASTFPCPPLAVREAYSSVVRIRLPGPYTVP